MKHPYEPGTRVEKINTKPGEDGHGDGDQALVLAHVGPVDGVYGYFVMWDDMPDVFVAIVSTRVRAVQAAAPFRDWITAARVLKMHRDAIYGFITAPREGRAIDVVSLPPKQKRPKDGRP